MKIRFYVNEAKPFAEETRRRLDADVEALEFKVVEQGAADVAIVRRVPSGPINASSAHAHGVPVARWSRKSRRPHIR